MIFLISRRVGELRVCEKLGWVRFLVVCFLYDNNPNPRKLVVGKSGPIAPFNLIFLGLDWPRVGEFVGFILISIFFQTQHNLVKSQTP